MLVRCRAKLRVRQRVRNRRVSSEKRCFTDDSKIGTVIVNLVTIENMRETRRIR